MQLIYVNTQTNALIGKGAQHSKNAREALPHKFPTQVWRELFSMIEILGAHY